MIVSFQGEKGAFSHLAAVNYWGNNNEPELLPKKEFKDVFDSVSKGFADYGILPIENSLTGSIHQNMDLFLDYNLYIVGEYILRIEHHLLANKNTETGSIKKVLSHPQGLLQCSEYLDTLKNTELSAVYDTAGAAKIVKEKNDFSYAAIAGIQAAREYGLKILEKNIENNHNNFTKFIIISREPAEKEGGKSSIIFSTKNVPGALFKCLAVFSLRDINLLKIESRPIIGKPWSYLFYLDFEGNINDDKCRKALNHLEELTEFIKFLGSYKPYKQ
ncbi:prephenate dehydratase [candidate division KSB1 bacterium]|nr:MAG: prephenate dehydratase [candidate division KSB1 bacterium]